MDGQRDQRARRIVLDLLRSGLSVAQACRQAGIARTVPYVWIRRGGDPEMEAALAARAALGGSGRKGSRGYREPVLDVPASPSVASERVYLGPRSDPGEASSNVGDADEDDPAEESDEPGSRPGSPAQPPQGLPAPQVPADDGNIPEATLRALRRNALGMLVKIAKGDAAWRQDEDGNKIPVSVGQQQVMLAAARAFIEHANTQEDRARGELTVRAEPRAGRPQLKLLDPFDPAAQADAAKRLAL